MAANYHKTESIHQNKERLFKNALQSALECGFEVKFYSEENGTIQANSAQMGMSAFGEKITIQILNNGEVYVKSECALPTQITSWGKNKRNVTRFFERLKSK